MTTRQGMKYIDKFGQIWITRWQGNDMYVWNTKCGLGLWDDGEGLEKLTPET